MMTQIQIHSQTLREIPFTNKKTGAADRLLVQTAYLHAVDEKGERGPVPDKFEIVLPKGITEPHKPGMYTLHPSAIYVDRNGRLVVSPRLVPVPAAK
jgi:Helix-destabilising protein